MRKPYYQDDSATLYCGDCAEILPTLEPVDLTVTSPPYDNLRDYEGYTFDFERIAQGLYGVTKPGGVVVWVVADATINGSETLTSFKQALFFREIGFNVHDTMIYLKDHLSFPETNRYYPGFEYMFVLSKGKPMSVNLIQDRKNLVIKGKVSGKSRQRDGSLTERSGLGNKRKDIGIRFNWWLIHHTDRGVSTDHPATFPEALANDHIRTWANAGDTVLDPMMGSGTTGKMAIINGCRFIGIDISEKYCEIAAKRLEQGVLKFG